MKNEFIQVELNSCCNNWAIKENLVFNFSISSVLYLTVVRLSSRKHTKIILTWLTKLTQLNHTERWPFYVSVISAVSVVDFWRIMVSQNVFCWKFWYKGICSWNVTEGGKEITMRKHFLVFCEQVSLAIAPSTSLWKNWSSFAKLVWVSEIPALSGSCSSSLPHSLSYWFLYFTCILYILE